MELTRTRFFVYAIIFQVVFGALIGLIPFFLGRRRHNARMGNFGLLASIGAGILSPLASVIVVAVFCWLIVKRSPGNQHEGGLPADNS